MEYENTQRVFSMYLEHLIYSTGIAIIIGMLYVKEVGRDPSWIIILTAYAPDIDQIGNIMRHTMGTTLKLNGYLIQHGDFHTLGAMGIFSVLFALLVYPFKIRLIDGICCAAIGFTAHLFEDALVFNPAYAFFWPISSHLYGIGLIEYTRDFFGIANLWVLLIGLLFVISAACIRTAYGGKGWVHNYLPTSIIHPQKI